MRLDFKPIASSPSPALSPEIGNIGRAQPSLPRSLIRLGIVRRVLRLVAMAPWLVTLTTLMVLGSAGMVEVGLVVGVVQGVLSITSAIAVHVAVVLALACAGGLVHRAGGRLHPLCGLFVLSTAWLGPVGSVGMALTALLWLCFSGRVSGVEECYVALLPAAETTPSAALYERLRRGGSGVQARDTLAPFSDVMASGTLDHRQAAISLISAYFKPAFASTLRCALNDDEPGVRVQAATAFARIESAFLKSSISLAERCALEPQRMEFMLALAQHFDEHANTGLLDADRAQAKRQQALDQYRECERQGTDSGFISNLVIRLLVRLGRQDEAVNAFAPLVANGQAPAELFAWYAECLFELGHYADLRQACRHFMTTPGMLARLSKPCRLALNLWASDGLPVDDG